MFDFFDTDQEHPSSSTSRNKAPGRVRFDDRGNAIYEWRDAKLEEESLRAEQLRERALHNPALSLVDDSSPSTQSLRNDKGARIGYNPYESGQLTNKPKVDKKRDMRELSKWIEMKRRLAAQPAQNASEK